MGKLVEFNFSRDLDYHTQINNKYVPYQACCPTSLAMASYQAGLDITLSNGMELDDELMQLAMTKGKGYQVDLAPWSVGVYEPYEVHIVMQYIMNDFFMDKVDVFSATLSISDLVYYLVKGCGIAISGSFDYSNGMTLSHVVSLAGFTSYQEDVLKIEGPEDVNYLQVRDFIIDDPFGDYRTKYVYRTGNNIKVPFIDFLNTFKKHGDQNNKWGHVVSRNMWRR